MAPLKKSCHLKRIFSTPPTIPQNIFVTPLQNNFYHLIPNFFHLPPKIFAITLPKCFCHPSQIYFQPNPKHFLLPHPNFLPLHAQKCFNSCKSIFPPYSRKQKLPLHPQFFLTIYPKQYVIPPNVFYAYPNIFGQPTFMLPLPQYFCHPIPKHFLVSQSNLFLSPRPQKFCHPLVPPSFLSLLFNLTSYLASCV